MAEVAVNISMIRRKAHAGNVSFSKFEEEEEEEEEGREEDEEGIV